LLRKIAILFSPLLAVAPACTGQDLSDYGSGTIYLLLTGRVHRTSPTMRTSTRYSLTKNSAGALV
jgi:hypothetical protein